MSEAGRLTEAVTARMDKATKRAGQAFATLEGRLDPVSRAMRRYESDVEKVRVAVEKGAASDARAGAVLDQLAA